MHFDLADLRLFIHIAESPSLTQAAKRAHLSLAAVSVRIKALENQLNTRSVSYTHLTLPTKA